MKNWIREWLGINQLHDSLGTLISLVYAKYNQTETLLKDSHKDIRVLIPAIGEVLAKLNPILAQDELDPARQAESKAIGEQIIVRLRGEDMARRHQEGKL